MMEILSSAYEQAQEMVEAAPKKPAKAKPVHNPDLVLQPNEKLDVKLSDWLKISSSDFKNAKKFPPLELPDGREIKIKIDDAYYRINDDYSKNKKNGPPSEHDFWFRLSGRHLYYAMNNQDINVLGSITVKNIRDAEPKKSWSEEPLCFTIDDEDQSKWKLCTKDLRSRAEWICAIKGALGTAPKDCTKVLLADSEVTILVKKVTQPIILVPQPSKTCDENWDYTRHGEDWECTCAEGKEQSPIDLPPKAKAVKSPAKPLFQYDEVATANQVTNEEGQTRTENLKIKFIDGTLRISHNNFGKIVTLDGSIYEAVDIIIHTPSEHTIGGRRFPMEIQIVHNGITKGDIAKQAILCFLFEKKPGVYNKFIDDVDFLNLPNAGNKERDILNSIYIPKILYSTDNEDLPIMKPFSFYTYQGSLTQPPCSERTIVYVAADPIPIGTTALTMFQEADRIPDMMDARGNVIVNTIGPENNRSTQKLNGRTVYLYDHTEFCGADTPKRQKTPQDGHFEKLIKHHTEYFYVDSQRPSGLPNTFVVSESEAKGWRKA